MTSRQVNYFDEFIQATAPGNAAAPARTLSLPEVYRQQSRWMAITRIVIVTTNSADGSALDTQRVQFFTDDDLEQVIDVAPSGNNSNDLASPILIRPGHTLHALWPAHTTPRNVAMRIQGRIFSAAALGI